jgi:alkylated DNA repair protein (DNA oxidative demethylase)
MRRSETVPADLFEDEPRDLILAPGAVLLGGFACAIDRELLDAVAAVAQEAPFRQMVTPGGWQMSVAMTNCGAAGWVTDRSGYRYDAHDPDSARPWPAMPAVFRDLATRAAAHAGYAGFDPDACLVNRYAPGSRLSLHQDRNERDFGQPIVSLSLGLPAIFLWGGETRAERPRRVRLRHGDVVVWGGPARMTFHGIDTLREGEHPATGALRYNLTLRRAH